MFTCFILALGDLIMFTCFILALDNFIMQGHLLKLRMKRFKTLNIPNQKENIFNLHPKF